MTNKEIDIRLRAMADAIPAQQQSGWNELDRMYAIQIELELLNMSAMTIFTMLGEIAKRLPEPKEGV